MRWQVYVLVALLLLPVAAYTAWDFYEEKQILEAREQLSAHVVGKSSAGLDREVMQSAAAYFALKPRNASGEMERHVLEHYRASLWRFLLTDPRATPEQTEIELARFEASEKALSQVHDE